MQAHQVERDVHWLHAVSELRWGLYGRKAVSSLTLDERGWPTATTINSGDISPDVIHDPMLRCALRLQDAANSTGWIDDGSGVSYGHNVYIQATNEGANSTLLSANFTGRGDAFEQHLQSARPAA